MTKLQNVLLLYWINLIKISKTHPQTKQKAKHACTILVCIPQFSYTYLWCSKAYHICMFTTLLIIHGIDGVDNGNDMFSTLIAFLALCYMVMLCEDVQKVSVHQHLFNRFFSYESNKEVIGSVIL